MNPVNARRTALLIFVMLLVAAHSFSASASEEWVCPNCGETASGNFCSECGEQKPSGEWTCPNCGETVTGNFCSNCGSKKPEGGEQNTEGSQEDDFSPQIEVLDAYFEAINNLDPDGVLKLTRNTEDDIDTSIRAYFVRRMGFYPGVLAQLDHSLLDDENDVSRSFLSGLGYTGSFEEMRSSYNGDMYGEGDGGSLFANLKASYELKDIKNADDCKSISYPHGLETVYVTDMCKEISKMTGLENVDKVYIAKIRIYWEYNGLPYGIDKSLCYSSRYADNEDLISSYESVIDMWENNENYAVIYRAGDEWYLLTDEIQKFSTMWRFEM